MLDIMAIRKQVQCNTHTQKMSRFVNLEDRMNKNKNFAPEAFAFMVVSLQVHWKALIA